MENEKTFTKKPIIKKIFIVVYTVWVVLFIMLLVATALYEMEIKGLLEMAGIFSWSIIFAVFWSKKESLKKLFAKKAVTLGRFLTIGWLAAILIELLLYFTLSHQLGISLLLDFVYTTPTYIGLLLGWWLLLKRYQVSNREVFFIGGLNGLIVEMPNKIITGQNPLIIILGAPVHIFLYGSLLLVPIVLLGLTSTDAKPLIKKYLFGLLLIPIIAIPAFLLSIFILMAGKGYGL